MLNSTDLLRVAPSIFTTEPSPRVSEDYKMIRTFDIVKALDDVGYVPMQAGQTRVRNAGRAPYTKHMLVFQNREWADKDHNGVKPRVLFWNSHDGTSCYRLSLGIFRMICSNGVIIKSSDFGDFRIKHHGKNVVDDVVDSIEHIKTMDGKLLETVDNWRQTLLSPTEQFKLAMNIFKTRYPNPAQAPIDSSGLLQTRRYEDDQNDLWTVFNRIQENVMKGGVSTGKRGPHRLLTTRPIRGVSENIRFNREAWEQAEKVYNDLMGRFASETV